MQILITNIGNRNIKYKGQVYSTLELKEEALSNSLSVIGPINYWIIMRTKRKTSNLIFWIRF